MNDLIKCNSCKRNFKINKIKIEEVELDLGLTMKFFKCPKCKEVFPVSLHNEEVDAKVEKVKELQHQYRVLEEATKLIEGRKSKKLAVKRMEKAYRTWQAAFNRLVIEQQKLKTEYVDSGKYLGKVVS